MSDIDLSIGEDKKSDCDFLKGTKEEDIKVVCNRSTNKDCYRIFVEVTNNGTMRPFPPEYFLDVLIMLRVEEIKSKKKATEQSLLTYQLKYEVIGYITTIRYYIMHYKNMCRVYDSVEDTMKFVESLIDYSNAALDADKYDLEVEKLEKENKHFIKPLIISAISMLIAFISILLPYIDKWYFNDKYDKIELVMQELKQEVQASKMGEPKLPIGNTDSSSEKLEATPLPTK